MTLREVPLNPHLGPILNSVGSPAELHYTNQLYHCQKVDEPRVSPFNS